MLRRTVTCGELRDEHIGQAVVLNGWVNSYRDHGNLIFIDLRDRFGLTQLVFDPDNGVSQAMMDAADKLRNEDVIAVRGSVRTRVGGPNPKLATGTVEVVVQELEVLSKTANPPFLPDDMGKLPNEEIRLKHRYVDLRRPRMQQILGLRHRVMQSTRRYFDENGFLEVETPILYKSTPEGAREFLVPNRHVPGSWYALPQSPQLFKQILMVSGCDRYMQICRCFRDEDPRADRQAEFSQIDLEMSFVRREHVMEMMEGFARRLWKDVLGLDVPKFQVMGYRDAMETYGIDRPDTRYDLKIVDVSELAAKTDFGVFKTALEKGKDRPRFNSKKGVVKAIRVPGGGEKLTRKLTDGYTEFVKGFGAGGVAVSKVVAGPDGQPMFETGVAKFLEPSRQEWLSALGLKVGDTVLFVADAYSIATKSIGELRQKVARDMDMVPRPGVEGGPWNFLWVVDFPMFERNKDTGKWVAMHHPFTSPTDDQMQAFLDADPEDEVTIESIVSAGYDMVLNGSEIAGGSVRIHNQDVQSKVFKLLGLTPEQAKEKFSFLLEALSFGAPPHAGIAFGLDRLIMHLVGTDNIRDVIAFPKTQIGQDLMTGAPGFVTEPQLKDLFVKNVLPEPVKKPE
ncbi:MAG: aspartate--tRNA ligase [Phycisphaerales bacterium]|nr:aspartate--tRNA ligase [Phycisphaerales bacterium]